MPTGGLENPAVVLMPTGKNLSPKTALNVEPRGVLGYLELVVTLDENLLLLLSYFECLCLLQFFYLLEFSFSSYSCGCVGYGSTQTLLFCFA